ncbi:MAG: PLP-dependent aminotransferase family protein [Thermoanaerobaculia bacterium]
MTAQELVGGLSRWRQGEGPAYQRLASALKDAIESGGYPPGYRFPAERALARALSVSRTTVVGAYEQLRQEGWLKSRQGSGSRVMRRNRSGQRPTERDVRASHAFERNTVFRSLVESPGSTVEFLGAHLPGAAEFLDEALRHTRKDLSPWLSHPGYTPMGLRPLREGIAAHLERAGLPTRPEQVLVTHGAQQAIVLAAQLYLQAGDAVVLEDPTYLGAIDVFTSAGARLIPVAMGERGARVDSLREAFFRESPRIAYLMPTVHNPLGSILPEAARREIVQMAGSRGVPIIEDHTLADLTLGDPPPPPLAAYARAGTILTIGSLSKLIWGGLRVGWIRAEESMIASLARLKVMSDLGNSVISQAVATRLLSRVEDIRESRRILLGDRLNLATRELERRLPDWRWHEPAGGLSLWVRLPRGNAAEFAEVALRHGVSVVAGSTCSPRGAFPEFLRIPFVQEEEVLREGIRRLAEAWKAYAPSARPARTERANLDVLV